MAITFHPKAGMVLICDFRGYIEPEIIYARQVVIVSPNHLRRPGLFSVVPLSTTAPNPVEPYHYLLPKNPVPNDLANEVWAKCDLMATVTKARLDRIRQGRNVYVIGQVSAQDLQAIRTRVALSVGVGI